MINISFIDTEVSESQNKALDFGAIKGNGEKIHTTSYYEFCNFIADSKYLCGHNVICHDSKYIEVPKKAKFVDTLYLSPILFPNKP